MKRIVLVDSDPTIRHKLCVCLRSNSRDFLECDSEAETLDRVRSGADVAILGRLPLDAKPTRLLQQLLAIDPALPVIVACSSSEESLEALNQGAFHVTRLPIHVEELALLAERALTDEPPRRRSSPPPRQNPRPVLVGECPEIRALRETARRLSLRPTTSVLVVGESGSGRGTIARLIHAETNPEGAFVDLADLNLDFAEERGLAGVVSRVTQVPGQPAEFAEPGTLFVREIADTTAAVQLKLLHFLDGQAQAEDAQKVRVIATSVHDLNTLVQRSLLRSDLAYRVAVVELDVPPLRQRRTDLPLLAEHFLGRLAKKSARPRTMTGGALQRLMGHSWPGNVCEFASVLETAWLMSDAHLLDVHHLPPLQQRPSTMAYRLPSDGIDFRELERDVLVQALRLASGNQTRAASLLGLTRDQIRYRIAKFKVANPEASRAA